MLSLLAGTVMTASSSDRVADAYRNQEQYVRTLCQKARLHYPPQRLYLRAFKSEHTLEVWGSDGPRKPFRLIQKYTVAGQSGVLGPKLREGDQQVPEGFYKIDRFNPLSRFHLSLGLNYPNKRDKIVGDPERPGTDIFIHGNCVSIGCLAMTDPKIEEIYILALEARKAGQAEIPVHIFPFRFDGPWPTATPELKEFWRTLQPAYDRFEKTRFVPRIAISGNGTYKIQR